jgi:hypothetical protein
VASCGLLQACSSPTGEEPRQTAVQPAANAKPNGPFVGTVRLLERRSMLGIRTTEYVTLAFRGPRMRRDVRSHSFTDASDRYGIVVDTRTDSVTYYIQDATRNVHCRIAKAEYLAMVAQNENVLVSAAYQPYSAVFKYFTDNGPTLSQEVKLGLSLGSLKDCRAVFFVFRDLTRCETMYSDQVRVAPELLAYIEHRQPAALPSLALLVHYTLPPQPGTNNPLTRLKRRINEPEYQTDFDGYDTTAPAAEDFNPPAGSKFVGSDYDLRASIQSSSSHHSHHFH